MERHARSFKSSTKSSNSSNSCNSSHTSSIKGKKARAKTHTTILCQLKKTSPKGTPREILLVSLVSLISPFVLLVWIYFAQAFIKGQNDTQAQRLQIQRKSLKSYLDSLPLEETTTKNAWRREEKRNKKEFVFKTIQYPSTELLVATKSKQKHDANDPTNDTRKKSINQDQIYRGAVQNDNHHDNGHVLTAYMEPRSTLLESIKPLPRRTTKASLLEALEFPQVQRCSTFLEQFGRTVVDKFSKSVTDPYLPWLHDFFPTNDGKHLKFIAQNFRNCNTGEGMEGVMGFWKPQVALFQPVPIVVLGEKQQHRETYDVFQFGSQEPSFRLANNMEEATLEATRFICRFHNESDHISFSLSQFPFNYEYVTWRKNQHMLEEESSKGGLNQSPFWLSQLLFSCPIPKDFQSLVREQRHIVNDRSNLWVDIIPIRTPVRSTSVLLTKNQVGINVLQANSKTLFDLATEYGANHTLPPVNDSGRWANLPICYSPQMPQQTLQGMPHPHQIDSKPKQETSIRMPDDSLPKKKPYRLVACTWTSASYKRRGNSVTVRDSHARLREWILFHKLVGFDHLYVYDNSPVESTDGVSLNLEPVVQEFPSNFVTYVRWPCTVCSNNRPMHKQPGDRSSQYAAEASCRERFGSQTEWMSFIDTDEYLVPTKNASWNEVLDEMEMKDVHVLKLRSSRGMPRHDLMEPLADQSKCETPPRRSSALRKLKTQSCLAPKEDQTFLRVYNCDYIKLPRPERFARAMKQIYRPEYVLSHFVHYSTVTKDIAQYHKEQPNTSSAKDPFLDWQEVGSAKEVFLDELEEGTLVHARSVLPHETIYRSEMCRSNSKHKCPLGFVCPNSTEWLDDKVHPNNPNPYIDDLGKYCNCWINEKVETTVVPKLEQALREHKAKLLRTF